MSFDASAVIWISRDVKKYVFYFAGLKPSFPLSIWTMQKCHMISTRKRKSKLAEIRDFSRATLVFVSTFKV